MAGKTVQVDENTFENEILKNSLPALVDFWAPWCGPCKAIGPVLEELAKEYDGKIKLAKVNVDDSPNIAAKYGIRAIPTLIFFKNGQQVNQITGAVSKVALDQAMQKLL